ncbi:MAG: signal peptide peptidase SppA, partial [Woeseia sp.]|nr:signal peptide peptidase SppA [Woeseia sp.]
FERTLETIGVHTDGVGTSVIAGSLRLDRTLNADARRIVQAMTDDDYEHFVSLVAAGRDLDVDSVQRIAQGQIWIGREALDNGLVDELGNLDAAIRAAAALAGLEEDSYGKRLFEKELSPAELFTLQFMGGAKALGLQPGWLRGGGTSLERVAGHVETLLAPLTRFNDPRGSYAHCFCDFSPVLTR